MTNYNKINVAHSYEGQILSIILDSPKGNVLDGEMMSEILSVLQNEATDKNVKALIFKAEGKHFSFGASVPEHTKDKVGEMLTAFHAIFKEMVKLCKPTFSVVQGQCLGGGMELAIFSNWIFASSDAKFGQPEVNLGVFPPIASVILPYLIGLAKSDDLILSGRTITAQEALEMHLVHSVSENPETKLKDFIETHILPKSAVALHFSVKSARYDYYHHFNKNINSLEKMYIEELMETKDANEGINSFLERRKPNWTNE
ncbi:MAG: cyclohexa-1,5-dienecarbonyl-CoA hydratase [Calditrichaeota bacterium]|nr:MAG: cyclohexa-1,5-dienecarbonyl-CoA hydratase [Calditrichota bacterium]